MAAKLLTEHHLGFLSLKGGYSGSSESTHVKMPHCWKSHVAAHSNKQLRKFAEAQRLFLSQIRTKFCCCNTRTCYVRVGLPTALPAKSDSDDMFCLQRYQGLVNDISLVY